MKIAPIPPEALRSVRGLDTPLRFYQVLRSPAPLAGMPFPERVPWKEVAAAGFESVVCLTNETAPYNPSPLRVLRAAKFQDLVGGSQPNNPQREADMLRDVFTPSSKSYGLATVRSFIARAGQAEPER